MLTITYKGKDERSKKINEDMDIFFQRFKRDKKLF